MATTNEILTAVVERLKTKITGVAVELYPDKIGKEGYRLNHPVAALLVGYHKSDYGKPFDTGLIVQERVINGFVTVVAKKLNGRDGTNTFIDQVAAALIGFRPVDCKPVTITSDSFAQEVAGQWQHYLTFKTVTVSCEIVDETDINIAQVDYGND